MQFNEWVKAYRDHERRSDALRLERKYRLREQVGDPYRNSMSLQPGQQVGLTARVNIYPITDRDDRPSISICIDATFGGTITNPIGELTPEELIKLAEIRRSIDRWVQGEAELPPSDE